MDSLSNKILKFSRKYFGGMILFAVCFGILLTVTKYMFSDTAVRTGDYLFTRTIMIQNKTGNVDNNFEKLAKNINFENKYIIYQGHHYNKFITNANFPLFESIVEFGV